MCNQAHEMVIVSRQSPEHPPASDGAAVCSDSGSRLVPLEGQAELARAESPAELPLQLQSGWGSPAKARMSPRAEQPASELTTGWWCLLGLVRREI